MNCSICRELAQAFEAELSEYIEARSSASYRVSTKLAAKKNVDMERARYELEEHRLVCVSAARVLAHLPEPKVTTRLRQLAA
jgi:cytidylate kinase